MATQASTSNTYSLPTALPHSHSHSANAHARKSWRSRLNFLSHSPSPDLRQEPTRESTARSSSSRHVAKWWKIRLFRGMVNDVRRRAPFYASDWLDAWDYRVVPATVYMYFAKIKLGVHVEYVGSKQANEGINDYSILPALAFSLDMFTKTNMSFGVNEVLLASVLGSVVFSIFAAQPLVIVGVTGPITVFN
ncbi:putative transporter [Lachnellula willkommii]|uniref:Putative transporter n=1 Tax=Lachnellula willkommii TaxID=215461 RepID=A0A559MFH1_9HELO|nr:putative transporter [Lachnellula willkommii]